MTCSPVFPRELEVLKSFRAVTKRNLCLASFQCSQGLLHQRLRRLIVLAQKMFSFTLIPLTHSSPLALGTYPHPSSKKNYANPRAKPGESFLSHQQKLSCALIKAALIRQNHSYRVDPSRAAINYDKCRHVIAVNRLKAKRVRTSPLLLMQLNPKATRALSIW